MDESSFDIDTAVVAEACRLFPAHRLAPAAPRSGGDLSYLESSPGGDFARHAWDEAGPL